jgi:hypothetical protein
MTATYWEIGRRIVQSEQAGEKRAEYVRAQTIRLFVPFGQKQGRGVHLKDQKLADVLAEFSRAKQRPVSTIFWNANLNVMQEACHLAQQVLEMLVLVHEARQP